MKQVPQTLQEKLPLLKDYLNIASSTRYRLELEHRGDIIDSEANAVCLSDLVFIFNQKNQRIRQRIVITEKHFYLFRDNHYGEITTENHIRDLEEIVLSSKEFTLFLVRFRNSSYILLDSSRRLEIVLYIVTMMKRANAKLLGGNITYLQSFKLKKLKSHDLDINKARTYYKMLPAYQETLRNAHKSGLMRMLGRRLFFETYTEYFFILTDLGLIYFKKLGQSTPKGFVPVHGATLKLPKSNENSEVFQIKIENYTFKLKCNSVLECREWAKAIWDIQKGVDLGERESWIVKTMTAY